MTDVTTLAALNSDHSKSNSSKSKLSGDLDSFLSLLTAQLKNQDPLSPMDSTEFTNQLVQFSGVEQAINTNTNLESLIGLTQASIGATAVGYIGKEVQAESATMPLQDGQAKYTYTLPKDASKCLVVIKDSTGAVVKTEQGQLKAGTYHMTWDGKNGYGEQLDDGAYTLEVQATDTDGKTIEKIYTTVFGKVTAVANDGDDVMIAAGPVLFGMSYIVSVRDYTAPTPPAPETDPDATPDTGETGSEGDGTDTAGDTSGTAETETNG
ncbi:Basal-body rod modification protein FlgD [uncultured Alphaproteobacteria bacterium]|uniref:Basal-body rod modification protein FlgD n=1 Tax=uncultured Alphaproteobacteria bacterium TaxID=91750 RepID=A0A212JQ48_9PROT|nr:Basal-body rod modification protein FlgD [uncultured Alphaproteobacteria bacterium]